MIIVTFYLEISFNFYITPFGSFDFDMSTILLI